MIYPYVICEPDTAGPPPGSGLGGAALRALRGDRLGAVYSRHRSLRPRPSRAALLAHERVVEAVMARGPVLPLRFGTRVEDETQLSEVLSTRRDEFLGALERVRGRFELGLRASPRRPSGLRDASSGRAYVDGLLRERRRAERAAHDLHAPLAELACDSRVRRRVAAPAVLSAAYLVDRGELGAFRERAEELAAGREDLEVVVTGPWPPYSFAGGEPP